MRILFAMGNEKDSDAIIKQYEQTYGQEITKKNVYYFNAIQKELQKDKVYDKIIISEDLEAFSNNNYIAIDKFIIGKLENIVEEAENSTSAGAQIILVCNDRREKSSEMLLKFWNLGIYNALIGKDRNIKAICELMSKPRTQKEAKIYYNIKTGDEEFGSENGETVSETEIQNILIHYKKLGKNEEKYVESFNSIAMQYTDTQLKLIIGFLPLNVRAVLEENCDKYKELVTTSNLKATSQKQQPSTVKVQKIRAEEKYKKDTGKIKLIEDQLSKNKITKPVIIPSNVNIMSVKKMEEPKIEEFKPELEETKSYNVDDIIDEDINSNTENEILSNLDKFGIGNIDTNTEIDEIHEETLEKRKRGRPRKYPETPKMENTEKRKRGRPRKYPEASVQESDIEEKRQEVQNNLLPEDEEENFDLLPGFEEKKIIDEEDEATLPGFEEKTILDEEDEATLPGFDEETVLDEQEGTLPGFEEEIIKENEDVGVLPGINEETPIEGENHGILPGFEEETIATEDNTGIIHNTENDFGFSNNLNQSNQIESVNKKSNVDISSLLTRDKKIVSFVGTSKNGTSFLVNNLGAMLSEKGIKTAILDLTKNKNAYYVYTDNQEELRKISYSCIKNLENGEARGIEVNKNLTVFTSLPGDDDGIENYLYILETLLKNYSLILLDCDFNTNYGYFKESQEIYLVQSYDVLTIQPLTAFLRDLKAKNVLNTENLRVVLNKEIKVRNVSAKKIIGGMSIYNDPSMSFMTELFNMDLIKYCSIPFEEQTYSKYLEGLVECQISLKGYSKSFLMYLSKLANMVYPLINNNYDKRSNKEYQNKSNFSNDMNDTLNKMKKKY